ncbi:kinetochore protein Spc25 isoform X2 [Manis javanica]|uniref:kinetochore protein Spc25 isoform X2 n=1 Tax=Manis javanica TaxID=9974 RepID=UPI003C6CEC35
MVEDELALFDKSINEFWNKFKSTVSDTSCQMAGLRDTYKDSIKALAEKLSVKLKEEERMVEMFLEYQNQICRQNKLIQEKKDNLLKLIAEVKGKKQQVEVLTANIQDLKEEYARKKETISTAKKSNEERLKRLQKSADLYKDRLGLEIRKIYDFSRSVGEPPLASLWEIPSVLWLLIQLSYCFGITNPSPKMMILMEPGTCHHHYRPRAHLRTIPINAKMNFITPNQQEAVTED